MAGKMPRIDVEALDLSDADKEIVRGIINTRTGCLRASAPETHPCTDERGLVYHVWRMVAFSVSPVAAHQCMPCTAGFYFSRDAQPGSPERKALVERGDRIERAVVNSIPKSQWAGIIRWGQVYGYVGSPRFTEEGAVIYR